MTLKASNGWLLSTLFLLSSLAAHAEEPPCMAIKEAVSIASRIRGLKLKRTVTCRVLKEEDFLKLENVPPLEKLKQEEMAYKLLGIVPKDYPYASCMLSSFMQDAVAYYDARGHVLNLRAGAYIPMVVLVHEITHALQAQNFPAFMSSQLTKLTSDEYLARLAISEGDAMWVEHRFEDEGGTNRELERSPSLPPESAENEPCRLPPALQNTFDLAYSAGELFVGAVRESGGQALLDRFFANPPRTTQEILHALKPAPGQKDVQAGFPALAPVGFKNPQVKTLFSDSLGELMMRAFFKTWLPRSQAVLAAAGWKGDRLSLHPAGSGAALYTLVWRSVWKNERDAEQFFTAIARVWEKRLEQPLNGRTPRLLFSSPQWPFIYLERAGRRVSVIVKR